LLASIYANMDCQHVIDVGLIAVHQILAAASGDED
jgi:hypothetical protein